MGVVNLKGSKVMTPFAATPRQMAAPGLAGGRVHYFCETVEVGSADSATSTYDLAILPANAVLTLTTRLYWDDLASTGSPTIDLGLFNPTGFSGITNDDDALLADLDAATVNTATGSRVVSDIANIGKKLWEFVNGQTVDPRQSLILRATLKDASVNVGGTLTLEGYYVLE